MNDYVYFVAIVEQGSMTKASQHLGIPKSKLSRRLSSLEAKIGSQLLIRTTRRQHLTEAGLTLYQACKPHVEALHSIEEVVQEVHNKVKGKLYLLLPLEFFNKVISALITDFALQYPDIEIHCHHYSTAYPEFDHQYDLVFVLHEEPLPTSNWIGKTLLSFPQSIYTSKNHYENYSIPMTLLNDHAAIMSSEDERWLFREKGNLSIHSPKTAMVLSSAEMRLEACIRNIGLVKLPGYIGENNPNIKAVLLERQVAAQQLTVLFQSRNIPMKTRTFLDYFQSKIGCFSEDCFAEES